MLNPNHLRLESVMRAGLELLIVDLRHDGLHIELQTIRGLCHNLEGVLKETKRELLSWAWGVGGQP